MGRGGGMAMGGKYLVIGTGNVETRLVMFIGIGILQSLWTREIGVIIVCDEGDAAVISRCSAIRSKTSASLSGGLRGTSNYLLQPCLLEDGSLEGEWRAKGTYPGQWMCPRLGKRLMD